MDEASRDEVTALRRRIAVYQAVIDALPFALFWKDQALNFLGCSRKIAEAAGRSDPDELLGLSDYDLPWTREQSAAFQADDRAVLASGQAKAEIVEPQRQADGSDRWLETSKMPLRGRDGETLGVLGWFRDITAEHLAARAEDGAREQLVRALSTPLLPVADGVIVLPLIGRLDAARVQQVQHTLLTGVAEHQARVAIVDITGLDSDDPAALGGLLRAVRAVRLLGAACILTGIGPALATALVHANLDLAEVTVLGDLKAGIAHAFTLQKA